MRNNTYIEMLAEISDKDWTAFIERQAPIKERFHDTCDKDSAMYSIIKRNRQLRYEMQIPQRNFMNDETVGWYMQPIRYNDWRRIEHISNFSIILDHVHPVYYTSFNDNFC